MRIIHIIPSLRKGGAERMVLDICREILKHEGTKVCLVSFSDKNDYTFLSHEIQHEVIPSKVIPSISGNPIVEIDSFLKFISDFKPDIIHSHLFEAELVSRWKLFPGIRYVSHCHDNIRQLLKFDLSCLLSKSRITDLHERRIIIDRYQKCNNNFIAISQDTKKYLLRNLPRDVQNIKLLHNAVDFENFKRNSHTPKSIPDKNNIKLINIGSFVEKKNQIFLVHVVKILKDKGYSVKLELLGDGPDKTTVENKISMMGLTDNIYCRGIVNDVNERIHDADIYVHSALYEPFGLVLLEAMSAGLPIVCLDGKGNRDIMENKKNGFFVKEYNPEIFADRLILLIDNSDLYRSFSDNVIAFAANFDIKSYVKDLLMIYNSCYYSVN